MTTSARRRRRATAIALVTTAVVLVVAGVVTAIGAATLANSREGRDAAADTLPTYELPFTPTALLGVLDDEGRLTSVATLVVDPTGVGGSIVSFAAIADSSLGLGEERLPLAETLATQGPEALRLEVEAMTALSFDAVELADPARLAELLAPIGDLTVDLPDDVIDDDLAEPVVEAGETTLSTEEAVEVLTAYTDTRSDRFAEPSRDAVWAAVADAVGSGIGTAEPVADGASAPVPATLDEAFDQLFAAPVGWRGMSYKVPDEDDNPRGVDTLIPDRAEILMVYGSIAPTRVGAPNPSQTFRIESAFTDEDLAPYGITNADLVAGLITKLLFVQANVVSVVEVDGEPPAVTQALIAEPSLVDDVEGSYPLLLGDLDVQPAEYRIDGIDITLRIGQSYLDFLVENGEIGTDAPTASPDPTTVSTPSASTTN